MIRHVTLYPKNESSYIEAEYDEDKGTLRVLVANEFDLKYEGRGGVYDIIHWRESRKAKHNDHNRDA